MERNRLRVEADLGRPRVASSSEAVHRPDVNRVQIEERAREKERAAEEARQRQISFAEQARRDYFERKRVEQEIKKRIENDMGVERISADNRTSYLPADYASRNVDKRSSSPSAPSVAPSPIDPSYMEQARRDFFERKEVERRARERVCCRTPGAFFFLTILSVFSLSSAFFVSYLLLGFSFLFFSFKIFFPLV